MPLFYLKCECGAIKPILANNFEKVTSEKTTCLKCGKEMQWQGKGPSTSIMEKLDNGSMPRAVERYSDAEQVFKERHENADENAGKKNFS